MSLKFSAETVAEQEHWLKPMEFSLPAGLIGFPDVRQLELIYNPEELPFMWLRAAENRALNFIVIEPQGLVPGYTIELSDDEAALLGIESAADVLLFNIVTLRAEAPESATVNLIGPIVVNRRTLVGRQMVITNFAGYSARHPLLAATHAGAAVR
jgi:flagellar assembly factor FliW